VQLGLILDPLPVLTVLPDASSNRALVGLSPCVDLHNFINLSCMLMFGISHFEPCDQSHNLLLNRP